MRTTSLLGLLLLPTVVACGAGESSLESSRLGTSASAIQDGLSDTKAVHNFAVGIASRGGAICSGTLIAPNLVLTARHCVVPVTGGSEAVTCDDKFPVKNASPSSLFVTTAPRFETAKKFYVAAEITTPTDTGFCGNDIALITLEENIPASEAQPAIPVVQFSMTDRTKVGRKIAALGYGVTSPSANDSGTRRIHEDIGIECVPGDTKTTCKGLYKSDSDREFITEGYVCSGDSGSGAFDQESFTSGTPYVLGALSRGPQADDRCLAAIYSRTDAHADLIIAAAQKAARSGKYDEPGWVSPQSENAAPGDTDPTCEGDTCTATDATEPGTDPAGSTGTVRKVTTTGCSAAPSSSRDAFGVFALAGIVGLVSRRRRRAG